MVDSAFEGAGQSPGLTIWRIENFAAVPYPEKDVGKFHSGDSYIVLHTKENHGTLSWDIHFWLGKETSQDEAGTAAIKSVELDDSLGGAPVQHREVQEHESELFLSYFKFKGGVRYLPGGVVSGFRHVDPDAYEKRLFQIKGKRNVRVSEVDVDVSAMNKGDCFILDIGKDIYIYVGSDSKQVERLRAITAANQIRDQDHAGHARVHIIDAYSGPDEVNTFFEELGSGSAEEVPDVTLGDDDLQFEKKALATIVLYKVSDESGEVMSQKVGEKPLRQDMLLREDCFILDTITSGLFVWIGKKSTKDEKLQSMKIAEKFLEQNNYPKWTRVQRVIDGGEPSVFKQYFSNWKEVDSQLSLGKVYTVERIAASNKDPEFNVASLHKDKFRLLAKSGGPAIGFMPDDGSGNVEVFRIENMELASVEPENYGMFFGGDSYVIKYTYNKDGRESYIVYFWQGSSSSQDEKAASAIHAVRLDNELNGKAVQVRVVQGQEPRHFIKMFKGHMIIFMGGHASGFKNVHEHDTYDPEGTRMFQVRGTSPEDVRALQVPQTTSSLNSDDVFIVETPTETFIWHGKGASEDEQTFGKSIATIVSPDGVVQVINEGEEPDSFWEPLGGQGDYEKEKSLLNDPTLSPRLFHCYQKPGVTNLTVEEVHSYTQEDLNEDDMMMLDTGEEIYVWVGRTTTPEEKELTMKITEDYLVADPGGRKPDLTLIFVIKQNDEPDSFKALFPSWDNDMWMRKQKPK